MKILFFISSLSVYNGGPSQSVPLLVRGLLQEGVDVTLLSVRTDNVSSAIDKICSNVEFLEKGDAREIESYLKSKVFDLIQLQSVWEPIYHRFAVVARKLQIPYVITPRGMLEPWSLSQKKWKKRIALWLYQRNDLQKAVCLYATSEMEARHLRQLGLTAPIAIIPNGIDTEEFPCRESVGQMKKQVLFLSRIHEKKGIELLLEAWNRLSKDFPLWSLRIVGNGEQSYVKKIRNLIEETGASSSVTLCGPVIGEEKLKLYQESSIFCLPSYSENFGMVIAEAMSAGVAVITTNNCPWEILNETETGWCIDLSVELLERTLREAMNSGLPTLFEKGQRASSELRKKCDYLSVASAAHNLYKQLLNE